MTNYTDWTVVKLRQLLRQRDLTVSGLKADLIARLMVDDVSRSVCCTNCHNPSRKMHRYHSGVCCSACRPWYLRFRRSVRRTIRALEALGYDNVDDIREQAAQLYNDSEESRNLGFNEIGLPYHGAIDDRHWSRLLHQMMPSHQARNYFVNGYNIDTLGDEAVAEILQPLDTLGVRILPQTTLLREQLAHFLIGTFGNIPKDRLVSIILQWSTADYFFRNSEAWARSFTFVQEVVSELGGRAHFTENGIRVTGSSNNLYEINPARRPPFYRVTRIHEEQRMHICIEPVGAASVVFGDIIVSLVLSLFEDQKSALRINTLHPHIFGIPRQHRNRNVDQIWHVALGRHRNQRREENTEPEENVWQHLLDRFQTHLHDWDDSEEEGEHA